MDLDLFLNDLQFHSDRVNPPDWEVNWEDAPLPYKLYRHLPGTLLSREIPFSLKDSALYQELDLNTISHFLWYVSGLTQYSQTSLPSDMDGKTETIQSFRRFAPSGGGLYPNELYIYLKLKELPAGIYHYDVAHHRLLLLRKGNFDYFLNKTLGNRSDVSNSFGAVIITTQFWKNFFKYHNFSYRLQGLDAGALAGQLLEVCKCFQFTPAVHFQFIDQAVNHLLGLKEQEESTYVVIPISERQSIMRISDCGEEISADEICKDIPLITLETYERSKTVLQFPAISQLNESSLMESTGTFCTLKPQQETYHRKPMFVLPDVKSLDVDLSRAARNRYSPEMDFISKEVTIYQLASLLRETVNSYFYTNDLDRENMENPRISLYGCLNNIKGIPDGAYLYDFSSHSLIQMKEGDFRWLLQTGMSLSNVNLHQIPMCFHIAGDRSHFKDSLGYRGHRIQHMEAGMLLQRLLLTASALGMNGHPLLGFDVNNCDHIYDLAAADKTTLLQIPVGFHRPKSWLTANILG
ncbi:SagB family peptide dehydrogenase [Halobacillus rhizosphaerae]|uniref:SagB family peptide dehydrogenase n=1 Tax=Halobacillus rhizosphaerae TaxID=3064889 RepID=UPI00398B82C0